MGNSYCSDNLSWENFSKVNNNLYDLNGVKPIISISRSIHIMKIILIF